MRTIHELLKIVLEQGKNHLPYGLCYTLNILIRRFSISRPEKEELLFYIRANKPFMAKALMKTYWWKQGNAAPRIKFLKKHIKKTKPK